MKKLFLAVFCLSLLAATGCTSRFAKISPGMTSQQVNVLMERGPDRVRPYPVGEYSAWYYGDDQCLLMQSDKVVGKSETEENSRVYTPVGNVTTETKAQCAPPGFEQPAQTETKVYTPYGGGTVKQ
jgi:hypothetical protein